MQIYKKAMRLAARHQSPEAIEERRAMMIAASGSRRNGFSLIEMLVGVAIVAVLAALLFPSFSSVRRSAKMAQSLHNLGQINVAFREFAADHGNRLPGNGSTGASRWMHMVAPYLGFTATDVTSGIPTYRNAYYQPVFHCPLTPPAAYQQGTNGSGSSYGGYGLNTLLLSPSLQSADSMLGPSYLTITKQASIVLLGEFSYLSYKGIGGSSYGLATTAFPGTSTGPAANYRSDGKPQNGPDGPAVYLFIDGHAETLTSWPGQNAFVLTQ